MITYLTTRGENSQVQNFRLSANTKNELPLYTCEEQHFINLFSSVEINNHYAQIASGFDIETSSFMHPTIKDKKCATMYIWQMAFKFRSEVVFIYGRDWNDWSKTIYLLRRISRAIKGKIIIYVHNLSYEFQWMWSHLYFTKVFSRKKRHPIYCQSDEIIFRCSYFLSNYSLRNLAKERGYSEKEYMDYSLLRHSKTKLTDDEISYSLTDVRILCEYISDEIRKNGKIQNIPLTSTGYARNYCLEYIKGHTNFLSYQNFIKSILPIEEELFKLIFQAYTGAFTHANYIHANFVLENVHCFDYSSCYPGVMCRKRFPMRFREASPDRFKLLDGMAMIIKITFVELKASTSHSILSFNKCVTEGKTDVDNGRIRYAEKLTTVITDLDYENINLFYKYESYEIEKLYVAKYEYLPKELIMSILELYKNKTTLKGVIGKEEAYLRSKELINSIYGMSVTNPLNDEIVFYMGNWDKQSVDTTEGLEKYKNGYKLFLAYQWGVWVTAWARWELLHTVHKVGEDVVYCDTDSIKCIGEHDEIFEADNERIRRENKQLMDYYHIPEEYFNPETIKHKVKTLGVWDKEDDYMYFKTLGAKRYCFSYYEDHYSKILDDYFESIKNDVDDKDYEYVKANFFITVAGLSKIKGKIAILKRAEKNDVSPFDIFSYDEDENGDTLTILPDESGKMAFSYSKPNDSFECEIEDYQGVKSKILETSFVHSENIPFNFGVTEEYAQLLGIITNETNACGEYDEYKINLKSEVDYIE